MTNSQRLATVRAAIASWICHEHDSEASEIVSESILIRDDFYCGRRFSTAHHRAVWFLEEDEVKILEQSGQIVHTMVGEQIDQVAALHSAGQNEPKTQASPTDADILAMPVQEISPADEDGSEGEESVRRAA